MMKLILHLIEVRILNVLDLNRSRTLAFQTRSLFDHLIAPFDFHPFYCALWMFASLIRYLLRLLTMKVFNGYVEDVESRT